MKRTVTTIVYWTLVSFVFALACDDDSDGNTVAGVKESKKISELTEEESYDLCVYVNEQIADSMSVEDQCLALGLAVILQGLDKTVCESAVDACLKQASENETVGNDPEDVCKDDGGDDKVSDCDATVGELDDCLTDQKKQLNNPLVGMSCSSTKSEIEQAVADALQAPASCQSIEEKCPGLLSESDEQSETSN